MDSKIKEMNTCLLSIKKLLKNDNTFSFFIGTKACKNPQKGLVADISNQRRMRTKNLIKAGQNRLRPFPDPHKSTVDEMASSLCLASPPGTRSARLLAPGPPVSSSRSVVARRRPQTPTLGATAGPPEHLRLGQLPIFSRAEAYRDLRARSRSRLLLHLLGRPRQERLVEDQVGRCRVED